LNFFEMTTMNAVVFHGAFDVRVEQCPVPTIKVDTDAIVQVTTAGLCGSELHMYRGIQKTKTGHIMGHEFVGFVKETGSAVKNFKPGDRVVSTFAAVCMKCWNCIHGNTNRCANSLAFGTQQLNGGQAEFVRVPLADGTMLPAPEELPDNLLILMSDIFPTGYYGASRAVQFFTDQSARNESSRGNGEEIGRFDYKSQALEDTVFVCLGCGPVGLCALMTAISKGVKMIYAVDSVDERLQVAAKIGAIPLKLGRDDVKETVLKVTDGRGADAVIELVGNPKALQSAFELLRTCGYLSSIGFHQEPLPFTGLDCYSKNLK
jgi:threonine dehydrogenase-like Zn-dependent dehydrogenase